MSQLPLNYNEYDEMVKELDEVLSEFLKDELPIKVKKDGESCIKCKSFCHFAEPNQSDGTLICYSCRNI